MKRKAPPVPPYTPHALGRAIAAYRAARNMSGDAFGAEVEISSHGIRRFETGESWPTLPSLHRIARFLGWSEEETGRFVLNDAARASRGGSPRGYKFRTYHKK